MLLLRLALPDFLAGHFVEGDHVAAFAARESDQLFAVDQRVGGVAPECRFRFVNVLEFLRPNHFAIFGVECGQIPFGTERVYGIPVHGRGRPRAGRIADGVLHGIFVLPNLLAGLRIQAEDALGTTRRFALEVALVGVAFFFHVIRHVHAFTDNGGAGVATRKWDAPKLLRPPLGELLEDALFPPDVVALRPHPLRPIVGPQSRRCQECGENRQLDFHHANSGDKTTRSKRHSSRDPLGSSQTAELHLQ